ncbi:MAG: Spy/CpxP family protein refolding chaperone [Xanthobacteraceae bacterium]
MFWPYAYDDIFGYVFAPWDSYDPFWGYGGYDLLAGLFGSVPNGYSGSAYSGDLGLPFGYGDVYGANNGETRATRLARRRWETLERATPAPADVAQMCGRQAEELTGLPLDRIRQAVQPTRTESANLDELTAASAKATEILAASCPSQVPITPPARVAAMQDRLDAMVRAVDTVQPALESFYRSLSDEQKARFDAISVEAGGPTNKTRTEAAHVTSAQLCATQTSQAVPWPEKQIEQTIQPTDAQRAALNDLAVAVTKAAEALKDSCPAQTPLTPTGRLAAVKTRLVAMLKAVEIERPALEAFYGSLSDEQKARFNTIHQERQSALHQE